MHRAFLLLLALAACAHAAPAAAQQPVNGSQPMRHARPPGRAPFGFGWSIAPHKLPDGRYALDYPVIKQVAPGSNAARAGLAVGDVLLSVDGRDTRTSPFFPDQRGGVRYLLRVRRGPEEVELTYVFPAPPPAEAPR
jgi:S1-C subfamily serine protease